MCGIELIRDVMTADELEHDAAPTNPMNPPQEETIQEARAKNYPLWSNQRRERAISDNSATFDDVNHTDMNIHTIAH